MGRVQLKPASKSLLEGLTVAMVRPPGPEMFRVLVRRFTPTRGIQTGDADLPSRRHDESRTGAEGCVGGIVLYAWGLPIDVDFMAIPDAASGAQEP